MAFASDIPNGVWPLNRAVGRAYLRETVATLACASASASTSTLRAACCQLPTAYCLFGIDNGIKDHQI
jgi:hypothetical protein